jgi:hypothetical protein
MLTFEIVFVGMGIVILAAASLSGTDPFWPVIFLSVSMFFVILERSLRGALRDRRRAKDRKSWDTRETWAAKRRTEQLVSIETLFGDQ